MKLKKSILFLFILTILFSCKKDDEPDETYELYEYEITGTVGVEEVSYLQTTLDSELLNIYFENIAQLNLIVYKNGIDDSEGYWSILMTGIDLDDIQTPYKLKPKEGYISWNDPSINKFKDTKCGELETSCFYGGESEFLNEFIITDVTNNQIVGRFSGRLNRYNSNPPIIDQDDFVEIFDGRFQMEYTRDIP